MKLIKSENAAAELVGHVLILGTVVIGISMITLYGVPSILGLQDMANLKNAEQTFAVLDSRASRTVLGDSPTQTIDINLGGGTLTVKPNSTKSKSYIVVKDMNNSFKVTIPMGKVEYQLGDRIVAYEGGGVWSKYPSGNVVLSRPEFNYNGWTLTLPVFNISGSASVGGTGTAIVSFKKNPPLIVFPNTSCPDCSNQTNPVNYVNVGKVYVNITSDYYDAWADYIETVSSVKVPPPDAKNRTVSIALTVYPPYIGLMNHYISNPIVFRGLDGSNSTPLNNFRFNITAAKNNLKWDIRAISGNKSLIFYLNAVSNWNFGSKVTLQVGYKDSNISKTETWEGAGIYTIQPDNYIYVDLLNESLNLTYTNVPNVGADNGNSCQPFGGTINGISNPDFSWDNLYINTSNANNTQPLYNITQHYIQKMAQNGDITFGQCGAGSNKPDSASTMFIDYYAPGGLTFLHITDNKADVSIS